MIKDDLKEQVGISPACFRKLRYCMPSPPPSTTKKSENSLPHNLFFTPIRLSPSLHVSGSLGKHRLYHGLLTGLRIRQWTSNMSQKHFSISRTTAKICKYIIADIKNFVSRPTYAPWDSNHLIFATPKYKVICRNNSPFSSVPPNLTAYFLESCISTLLGENAYFLGIYSVLVSENVRKYAVII